MPFMSQENVRNGLLDILRLDTGPRGGHIVAGDPKGRSVGFIGSSEMLDLLSSALVQKAGSEPGSLATIPIDGPSLSRFPDDNRVDLWIVADPEPDRLDALRDQCPEQRFVGLGQDLFPALVARRPRAIFDPTPEPPSTLCLIIAPPRSGSSFVADRVGRITGTKTREHLRKDVVSALAAPYAFDRVAAIRRFLGLIANPDTGQASTKIITHFIQDYVAEVGDLNAFKEAAKGIDVKPIIVERLDHVGQAVSGYLAMARGIWHLESDKDAAALASANEVPYDFKALLQLYLGYRQQGYVIDFAREIFPDHLALEYGRDIEAGDAVALGARIAEFLGLPCDPGDPPAGRAKLANEENTRLCARFREDYEALLGTRP